MAPCRSAADATSLTGTYRNSASGSTNLLISHGHAIRSTLAFFRVTHLISSTPVVGMSSSSILLRMTVMLQDLSVAIQVAFGLLALATLADWVRHRDAQRTYLVLALVFLALVVLIGPNAGHFGVGPQVITDVALVIFLFSGYFLLLFRDSLIPLGASARAIITVGIAIVGAVGIVAGLPSDPGVVHTPVQAVALSAAVATSTVCAAAPILRRALHDLLLYSPDRASLAERALEWSTRLVGGAGAFIVDSDGSILVARGITVEEAAQHAAHAPASHSTLVLPLELEQGRGSMTIVAGPFTPLFGQDEVFRLRQYAGSITAGLDRVSLTDRLAALEKAKSEFLNIASHELRGPMTVIKGYLTMIAAGSLGDLPSKTKSVLPLLIAKSDEVTSLLEQMIEASRLEDGRMALKKERSDITELTHAAIENLRPLLSDHELKVEMPPRPAWAAV